LRIGEVRLYITEFTDPCSKIARAFKSGDFMRVDQNEHPGWSRLCARVLEGGIVRPGDEVILRPPN
jgi:MOSC domain-containing protein YiiM